MIFLNIVTPEGYALGLKTDQGVLNLTALAAASGQSLTPSSFYQKGLGGLDEVKSLVEKAGSADYLDEASLQIGPVAPTPGKIICIGLNYRQHAIETNAPIPTFPVVFSKFNNTISAPNQPILLPTVAVEYDYEVELAVVIGRKAHYVKQEDALGYVLGYCTANDLSVRDMQMRTSQWLLGKTFDGFSPMGPYLVTSDEITDPQNLWLRCWVNGEKRQDSNTKDMIFPVDEIVSYLSQYMTLEAGDVILTGTPQGVVLGMAVKNWLKPGDEVTVEIEKLGSLTNRMAAED
ncbi:MAG: fumarylacetoacetate hydrolase family protein [Chloroflexi bacterium]|nr:fumarylacetoacetate hydrolase family protein [Chloroflexota bacterium]OJV95270.1 MAG: 5-carboxymethyl-2-hydroxymuconate isomerase [Chloroflexi bacterium 54-19]